VDFFQAVRNVHTFGEKAKAAATLIDFQPEETARELGVLVQILVLTEPATSFYAARWANLMRALKSRVWEGLQAEQTT
jgi:hypothetical protein